MNECYIKGTNKKKPGMQQQLDAVILDISRGWNCQTKEEIYK